MNDKIRMLEAKRARLVADIEAVDLALARARTGYEPDPVPDWRTGRWEHECTVAKTSLTVMNGEACHQCRKPFGGTP